MVVTTLLAGGVVSPLPSDSDTLSGSRAGLTFPAPERRTPGRRERIEERIRSEFLEMPGVILSMPQAQRLFGLRMDICERLLLRLVATGFLVPRRLGYYGRPLDR